VLGVLILADPGRAGLTSGAFILVAGRLPAAAAIVSSSFAIFSAEPGVGVASNWESKVIKSTSRTLVASAGVALAAKVKIITTATMRAIVEREILSTCAPQGLGWDTFTSGIGTFAATVYMIVRQVTC